MISAVVDTNVLVSGMGWPRSTPAKVVESLLAGRFLLISSPLLLEEFSRVLRYPKLAKAFPEPDLLVSLVREIALVVEPRQPVGVLVDDPDNRLLEAAREATADFIVTGDGELLSLELYEATRVVTPRTFLQQLERTP